MITVLPVASGGPILPAVNMIGWLYATMRRAYAVRFAHRVVQHPVAHREGLALHLGDEACAEIDHRGRHLRVVQHLANGIAAVDRIEHRQLFGVRAQHGGDPAHQRGALERLRIAPRPERPVRGLHGRIHVRGIGFRARAQALAGRRIERVEVAALRLLPRAVVVQVAVARQDRFVDRHRPPIASGSPASR